MKGRWRDGLNKFRRDNNVHWRGIEGRCANTSVVGAGFDNWNECGIGSKKYWGRFVHKGERRAIKAELRSPDVLADAYWELYELDVQEYYIWPETENTLWPAFEEDVLDWLIERVDLQPPDEEYFRELSLDEEYLSDHGYSMYDLASNSD